MKLTLWNQFMQSVWCNLTIRLTDDSDYANIYGLIQGKNASKENENIKYPLND